MMELIVLYSGKKDKSRFRQYQSHLCNTNLTEQIYIIALIMLWIQEKVLNSVLRISLEKMKVWPQKESSINGKTCIPILEINREGQYQGHGNDLINTLNIMY